MTKYYDINVQLLLYICKQNKPKPFLQLNYQKLEYFLSEARLNRFLVACNGSPSKAQKLYGINLEASQAVYPLLNLFEIFFRNAVDSQIANYFDDPDWIINQQNGFMDNLELARSGYFIKVSVQRAANVILRKSSTVSTGKIIAEQPFGFWSSFFEPHHFRLVGGAPLQCFVNKPANINRKSISLKLDAVRNFRNRVYHNEPICFNGTGIDFSATYTVRQHIIDMLNWIDPELSIFIAQFDRVQESIRKTDTL